MTPTTPTKPAPPAHPDRDADGVPDRFDAAPDNAKDRRWNAAAGAAFETYVKARTLALAEEGIEIDCADYAAKLLHDFSAETGIANPMGAKAEKWQIYTPERTGGLPNVQGPNYFLPGLGADDLAKAYTRPVNDADGNGVAGFDRKTGQVDVADLRAGDMLFYDWDGNGKVDHTVQVLDVKPDGGLIVGYGTYDNLAADGKPVSWKSLDLSPIQAELLEPGTERHAKWLGPDNHLWGVRRYAQAPDKAKSSSVMYVPYVAPPEPASVPASPASPTS